MSPIELIIWFLMLLVILVLYPFLWLASFVSSEINIVLHQTPGPPKTRGLFTFPPGISIPWELEVLGYMVAFLAVIMLTCWEMWDGGD